MKYLAQKTRTKSTCIAKHRTQVQIFSVRPQRISTLAYSSCFASAGPQVQIPIVFSVPKVMLAVLLFKPEAQLYDPLYYKLCISPSKRGAVPSE